MPSVGVTMYATEDLYLAAALQETGQAMESIRRTGHRATFEFADSTTLEASIDDYFAGRLRVSAHGYAERIRSAKSMAVNAPMRTGS
jgi:hypothetical protein